MNLDHTDVTLMDWQELLAATRLSTERIAELLDGGAEVFALKVRQPADPVED